MDRNSEQSNSSPTSSSQKATIKVASSAVSYFWFLELLYLALAIFCAYAAFKPGKGGTGLTVICIVIIVGALVLIRIATGRARQYELGDDELTTVSFRGSRKNIKLSDVKSHKWTYSSLVYSWQYALKLIDSSNHSVFVNMLDIPKSQRPAFYKPLLPFSQDAKRARWARWFKDVPEVQENRAKFKEAANKLIADRQAELEAKMKR